MRDVEAWQDLVREREAQIQFLISVLLKVSMYCDEPKEPKTVVYLIKSHVNGVLDIANSGGITGGANKQRERSDCEG
jgi:hypothetical protein